jgi:hypothetical protein
LLALDLPYYLLHARDCKKKLTDLPPYRPYLFLDLLEINAKVTDVEVAAGPVTFKHLAM